MELILLNIYTNLLTKAFLSLFIILVELSRKDKDRQKAEGNRDREGKNNVGIDLTERNIHSV